MRHFLIDPEQLAREAPTITGPDVQHMRRVLRLKPGDRIGVLDGLGAAYEARILTLDANKATIQVIGLLGDVLTTPAVEIGLAQALLKDKKMDLLVRQATELGVSDWMPFVSGRSVPRPDPGRLARREERWEKIAREALKQCRRPVLPRIHPTAGWEELLAAGADWHLRYFFWEGARGKLAPPERPGTPGPCRVLLVCGPEGGFSREEADRAVSAGFLPVSLGPGILRSETAAVAVLGIAQYLFGDMGEGAWRRGAGPPSP